MPAWLKKVKTEIPDGNLGSPHFGEEKYQLYFIKYEW